MKMPYYSVPPKHVVVSFGFLTNYENQPKSILFIEFTDEKIFIIIIVIIIAMTMFMVLSS